MPVHRPKSSARVARHQNVQHDPHRWLRRWCQSLGWTLAHAVVAPLQLKGIDLTRVHELPTDPHRLWLSRLVRIATTALSAAIGLYCEDRFSRNQNKTTHWSPAVVAGWGGEVLPALELDANNVGRLFAPDVITDGVDDVVLACICLQRSSLIPSSNLV